METLADLIDKLDTLKGRLAIYAERSWSSASQVAVVMEPADGSVPDTAGGLTYMTTVRHAREAVRERLRRRPNASAEELAEAVIYFARYDALEPLPSQSGAYFAA